MYKESIRFNEFYKLGLDAGPYIGFGSNDWMRYGIRGSLERKLSDRCAVDLGFMYNHVDMDESVRHEYRPHQSLHVRLSLLQAMVIKQRLRLEERLFKVKGDSETDFSTRLRYRVSARSGFNGKPVQPKAMYYALSAEWNMNVIKKSETDARIERGRYGVGLGYQFNTRWETNLNWFYQAVYKTEVKSRTSLNIFEFSLRHTLWNKS
ncbi:MAG: DUF2490 domain-containing protein [Marinilabiliaceae bacterium]|nr:DUF2490 domain-containing protein [Marinilabiliaceae bacterium]